MACWSSARAAAQQATSASVDSLTGEYTDPDEPDTPLSFYVKDGKLIGESERRVPTELRLISATEFGIPESKDTLKFTRHGSGHGATVVVSSDARSLALQKSRSIASAKRCSVVRNFSAPSPSSRATV